MAIKTVRRGAPAKKLITPIAKPTSRGVIESGERARLIQRTRGIPVPSGTTSNGFGVGSQAAPSVS